MYALYLVGPIVERLYGPVRFVGFYVVAAIFASLTTFAFGDAPRGTGASGAIFGLFGILFIATRLHLPVLDRASRNIAGQIGILILINIGFGLEHRDRGQHGPHRRPDRRRAPRGRVRAGQGPDAPVDVAAGIERSARGRQHPRDARGAGRRRRRS